MHLPATAACIGVSTDLMRNGIAMNKAAVMIDIRYADGIPVFHRRQRKPNKWEAEECVLGGGGGRITMGPV